MQQIKAGKKSKELTKKNEGWKVLSPGKVVDKRVVIANLETLLSIAGTEIFPDLTTNHILIIEETEANFSKTERNYRHLQLLHVFDKIGGLIISKPGSMEKEDCPFERTDLLKEIIGNRSYPIIMDFDCGHTFPMLTIPQNTLISLFAHDQKVSLSINENTVE